MHMCVRTNEKKKKNSKKAQRCKKRKRSREVTCYGENASSENALHYRIYIYTYTILRVK